MINSIKKFLNIAFKRKTWPRKIFALGANHSFYRQNAPMDAFVDTTGKRGRDKSFIKDRIQNSKNSVMQNAVANRCFMNVPHFRVANIKSRISLMLILFCRQVAMQLENVLFKLKFKRLHILFVTLV